MRIAVLGAGPAGLLFAALHKSEHPTDEVVLFEQNAADATFGFGVVFSDTALDFLRDAAPAIHALIAPSLEIWSDITLVHRGRRLVVDGIGFSAVTRLTLLQLLQSHACDAGVDLRYDHTISSLDELAGFDLVVGADGVNSLVRRSLRDAFGTAEGAFTNKFVWYGTTAPFDTLTQTFVTTDTGTFNAHHYRYVTGMSTFIVECDPATWQRSGFAMMSEAETAETCGRVFGEALRGQPLISNRSSWRNFPKLWCEHWHHADRYVLLGDAAHTAHFSIGSGTRLAFEDAIALSKALTGSPGAVAAALDAYQLQRQPIVRKIVTAANASAAWYDAFPVHMELEPEAFAMSYMTRSGRVDLDRLRAVSPRFMAAVASA